MSLKYHIRLAIAFIRKELLSEWSYKFSFIYQIGALFSTTLTLFFISRMLGDAKIPSLNNYGGDYFTFSITGVAFLDYMWVSMRSYSQNIRLVQVMGTLEAMLMTPSNPLEIIIFSSLYTYILTLLRTGIYLIIANLLFGANFGTINFFSLFVFTILMILCFSGFGLISASLTLYMKKVEPITSLFGGIFFLFGGIVYPVSSLPEFLQKVSFILPITHCVEGIRYSLIKGESILQLKTSLFIIFIWVLITFLISFVLLKKILNHLKKEGSFGAY